MHGCDTLKSRCWGTYRLVLIEKTEIKAICGVKVWLFDNATVNVFSYDLFMCLTAYTTILVSSLLHA